MKKFKNFLFAFVFLFAAAASFATVQMTGAVKKFNTFHYTSDSDALEDMQDIGNWDTSGPSCSNNGNVPCSFNYEGDIYAFIGYLNTEYDNAEDLIAAANERREVVK